MKRVLVLALAAHGLMAATTVCDTMRRADAKLASGSFEIHASVEFSTPGGVRVTTATSTVTLVNGRFCLALEPNDTSDPTNTYYAVTWNLTGARPMAQRWYVPTTASTLKVKDVMLAYDPPGGSVAEWALPAGPAGAQGPAGPAGPAPAGTGYVTVTDGVAGVATPNAASGPVVLDGSSRLPPVDGSQLTGITSLPDQTGHSGEYLQSMDGAADWAPISGGKLTATFLLCAGPCVVNETSNWKWTAPFDGAVTGCIVDAQTYPTGAAITVDVLKAGTTTIFSSTLPTLAAGGSAYNEQTGMAAAAALTKGEYLVAKVLTIGNTIAGQFVNLVCTVTY